MQRRLKRRRLGQQRRFKRADSNPVVFVETYADPIAECDTDSRRNTDALDDADTFDNANTERLSHSDAFTNGYPIADTHTDAFRNADSDANTYTYTNADSDAHTNAHFHPNPNPAAADSDAYRHADRNGPMNNPMKYTILATTLCLVAAAPYLAGCGGSSGTSAGSNAITSVSKSTTAGKAVFSVVWPARTTATSRLIPQLSNAIVITVSGQGIQTPQSQTLARPYPSSSASQVGTIEFDNLPVGDYMVVATAFPNADGSGTSQATGATPTTIHAGQTTQFSLTMGSTISKIQLAAANSAISLPAALNIGDTLQLVATALNSSNQVVLANLQWTATDPNTGAASTVASVDATGKVTAHTNGGATITVTDPESGKSATTALNIALTYTATDLGSPGLGYTYEGEAALNNSGQVASVWLRSAFDGGQQATYLWTAASGFTQFPGTPLEEYFNPDNILGFNDSGQLLQSFTASGRNTFLYTNGVSQDLSSILNGESYYMNNSGQIVGRNNNGHAFFYSNGTSLDLGVLPHGGSSTAYCINDGGTIVGSADTIEANDPNDDVTHAFLIAPSYTSGTMQDLPVLATGDINVVAYAINNSGSLVGSSSNEEYGFGLSGHAFLYSGSKMQSLEAGTSTKISASVGSSINNSGVIVGQMSIAVQGVGSTSSAFVYSGGSLLNLNNITSGLNSITLYDVYKITNNGSILAVGDDAKNVEHLVLLTPTAGTSKSMSVTRSVAPAATGVPTSRLPKWFFTRHAHKAPAVAKS